MGFNFLHGWKEKIEFLNSIFIAHKLNKFIMDPDTRDVLSQCTFRAAAFWRLLYQVWKLTKIHCPEAFPVGSLCDRNIEEDPKHIETLVSMIFEMNCGTAARSGLADAVILVVRAFTAMPELLPTLQTQMNTTTIFGPATDWKSKYAFSRTEEMMNLARDFYTMANTIENKEVRVKATLINDHPDANFYLRLSVYES